ncbi:hypothetical protein ABZ924_13895 [Streptomyces sp. NPDC046876]
MGERGQLGADDPQREGQPPAQPDQPDQPDQPAGGLRLGRDAVRR